MACYVSAEGRDGVAIIGYVAYDDVSWVLLTGSELLDIETRALRRCILREKKSDEVLCIYTDLDVDVDTEDVFVFEGGGPTMHRLKATLRHYLNAYLRMNGSVLSLLGP